jgi:hypothetical protein
LRVVLSLLRCRNLRTIHFVEENMKSIRHFVPVLAGVIGVSGAWGAMGVGCSSSSSGGATVDGGPGDATTDTKQPDVVVEASGDTGAGADADAATHDADAATPEDSAAPDADAGLPDVGALEGGANEFGLQVAVALCDRIAACCGTSADAATFDRESCLIGQVTEGFHGSNLGTQFLDGGNVTFNASVAKLCIDTISSMGCVPDQITSAQEMVLFQSCLGAFTGQLTVGSSCQDSIECAPGSFCLPADAGAGPVGLCQPLAGDGGACGVFPGTADTVIAQSACSYRGAAANGLFCQSFDAGTPNQMTGKSAWTCAPQEGLGTGCFNAVDCTSFLCDPTSQTCVDTTVIFAAAGCSSFLLDAGAGD